MKTHIIIYQGTPTTSRVLRDNGYRHTRHPRHWRGRKPIVEQLAATGAGFAAITKGTTWLHTRELGVWECETLPDGCTAVSTLWLDLLLDMEPASSQELLAHMIGKPWRDQLNKTRRREGTKVLVQEDTDG